MTTFPSNRNQDWTATQAAPWRTPSPDAATMAGYYPPTAARPAYGPDVRSAADGVVGRAAGVQFGACGVPHATAAVVCASPCAGLRRRRTRRRRCRRPVRCTARLVEQHPGEHRRPERTRTCTGPSTGTRARTRACCPAGGAQLPVDVPLDGVEWRIHRARKPSGTAADPAGPAGTAQR